MGAITAINFDEIRDEDHLRGVVRGLLDDVIDRGNGEVKTAMEVYTPDAPGYRGPDTFIAALGGSKIWRVVSIDDDGPLALMIDLARRMGESKALARLEAPDPPDDDDDDDDGDDDEPVPPVPPGGSRLHWN